jgi:outer membrane protein assembly factor BamB
MSLQGDVSGVGLSEVFQMISMSMREGTLIVQDAVSRKSFHFGAQGVRVLSTGERKGMRLGDILVRTQRITAGQLQEVLERAGDEKKMLGEALIESGYVTGEEIQEAVRRQIEEEIYDLFLWKKAKFEFIDGPSPEEPGQADLPITKLAFDVNGLLLEAMRRSETWEAINRKIPSLDGIFVFVSEEDRAEEDRTARDSLRRVYRLLDGHRTVAELIEDTVVPKFEACKCLLELIERDRIRALTVPELLDRAAETLSGGDRKRALRLYGAAEAQAFGIPKALEGIATALQAKGLVSEAASCRVKIGRAYLERKDLVRAQEQMRWACDLKPDEVQGRVGLLDVLVAGGDIAKAKDLARVYISDALRDADPLAARALCDRIVAADSADLEFRVFRAKAFHHANQPKDLQEELGFIHRNLPSDEEEAEKIKRQLPESTRLRLRLPALAPPAAPRRAWKAALAVLILLVLALGGAAAKYEMNARAEIERVIGGARKRMGERAWREAREPVEAFLRGGYRHAYAPPGRAAAFLRELDEREGAERDQKALAENLRLAEERKRREEEAGIQAELKLEPARALERARALAVARSKGLADDLRRAEALVESLEKYLDDARLMKVRADVLIGEGKYAEAAEAVDRLLADFPNTEASRDAAYPLAITSRPRGVKVTSARTGAAVGVTSETPLLFLMKPSESVRLTFEKPGYVSPPPRDVSRKTAGTLHVELTEKLTEWTWTAGHPLTGDPAVTEDLAFVAGSSYLHAIKLGARPEFAWTEKLEGVVEGSPRAANGLVYVATQGHWLYAIDPRKTGPERTAKRYALGDRASGTPGLSADGAVVYVGSGDKALHAVNALTLEPIWKLPLSGEARMEPLSDGTLLFVACDNGMLAAFETSTRREVWKAQGRLPFGQICLAGGALYVCSPEPFLYGVDASKGRNIWPRRALPSRVTGRPLRVGNLVLAGGADGHLYLIDALTGESAGSFPGVAAIRGGAVSAGAIVLFGNDEGVLQAIASASLEPLWKLRCKGPIRGTPAVAGGRIFFSSGDTLYVAELD